MSTPDFVKVDSSLVSEVAYDAAEATLHVKFTNGQRYAYYDVAPKLHAELMQSKSIGRFFGENVRGKFRHSMIQPDAVVQA